VLQLEECPPVYDYKELLPPHVVESFRKEFRAMKAAEQAAAAAEAAPLGEVQNQLRDCSRGPWNSYEPRAATPALSQASSRPLTGHAEYAMPSKQTGPPEPRPWSKQGRRGAPYRGSSDAISECLSWN
jgi:hypothetical protein